MAPPGDRSTTGELVSVTIADSNRESRVTVLLRPSAKVLLLIAVWAVGCQRAADSPRTSSGTPVTDGAATAFDQPVPRAAHSAGSESCRACHAEIASRYDGHSMSHSASLILEDLAAESAATGSVPAATDRADRPERGSISRPGGWSWLALPDESGRMIHRQTKVDSTEAVVFEQSLPMDVRIGSGRRGHAYLREEDQWLLLSPLAWFSQTNHWGRLPDSENGPPDFDLPVSEECLACHVGRVTPTASEGHAPGSALPAAPPDVRDRSEPGRSRIVELGLGCERCHGPAADHVAWRRLSAAERTGHDPIPRLGSLDRQQRNSLCGQCHVAGAERVLSAGRGPFDFRPGDTLSEIWLTFVTASRANGHLTGTSTMEQMIASRCYQQSGQQLTCLTCHDPHERVSAAERLGRYRDACLSCHPSDAACRLPRDERLQTSPGDSCIDCHMPRDHRVSGFHASRVNHRIPRRAEDISQRVEEEQFVLLGAGEHRIDEFQYLRARGLLMARYAQGENDALLAWHATQLMTPLLSRFPWDVRLRCALGQMWGIQQVHDRAVAAFQQALRIDEDDGESLRALGLLAHQRGDFQTGQVALTRYVALHPWDREATGRAVHLLGQSGQFDAGLRLAEQAVHRFPADWQLHGWLADVYQIRGRVLDAETHRRLSQQLRPPSTEGPTRDANIAR